MTPEGSAIFGAQWKTMEAKIVGGPAIPNAMPGYTSSYDIQPHAGESGFDDSHVILSPYEGRLSEGSAIVNAVLDAVELR